MTITIFLVINYVIVLLNYYDLVGWKRDCKLYTSLRINIKTVFNFELNMNIFYIIVTI